MCGVCHVSGFNCVSAVDVGGGGGSKSAPPFAVSHTQRLYQALVHTLQGPKLAGATSPNATKFCIRRLRLQKLSPLVAT